jgi:hypothetical protein
MLTLSIPAAPRLRLTFRKAAAIISVVILPVNECVLIFLAKVGPFLLNSKGRETCGTSRRSRGGCFLVQIARPE